MRQPKMEQVISSLAVFINQAAADMGIRDQMRRVVRKAVQETYDLYADGAVSTEDDGQIDPLDIVTAFAAALDEDERHRIQQENDR